jgi:hypothetical protein
MSDRSGVYVQQKLTYAIVPMDAAQLPVGYIYT